MNSLDAAHWQVHVPAGEGEKRSVLFELIDDRHGVEIDIRASVPVELLAVTKDGLSLHLDWGQVIRYHGRLIGFVALEVVADRPFAYRMRAKGRWLEKPDTTRMVVALDESHDKPIQDLVKAELKKYVGRLEASQMLQSDVDIEELLDDIDNGDHEFEAEPDMFGLGYEERNLPEPDDPQVRHRAPRAPAEPVEAPEEGEPSDPPAEQNTGGGTPPVSARKKDIAPKSDR